MAATSVSVSKIDNGYVVAAYGGEDGQTLLGTTAVLKTAVGNVPTRLIGLAVARALGKITREVAKKPKRAYRKAAAAAAPAVEVA